MDWQARCGLLFSVSVSEGADEEEGWEEKKSSGKLTGCIDYISCLYYLHGQYQLKNQNNGKWILRFTFGGLHGVALVKSRLQTLRK